jgi:hypothetical protein
LVFECSAEVLQPHQGFPTWHPIFKLKCSLSEAQDVCFDQPSLLALGSLNSLL